MNVSEGMRRIALAIRFMGALLGAGLIWFGYRNANWKDVTAGIVIVLIAWGVAWVVDGFATPKS